MFVLEIFTSGILTLENMRAWRLCHLGDFYFRDLDMKDIYFGVSHFTPIRQRGLRVDLFQVLWVHWEYFPFFRVQSSFFNRQYARSKKIQLSS